MDASRVVGREGEAMEARMNNVEGKSDLCQLIGLA